MVNIFFYEITSTWIEDIIVPDSNDYLYFVNDFFDNPEQAWDEPTGYSLALFGHYLSTIVNNEYNQINSTVIREIWEKYSEIRNRF